MAKPVYLSEGRLITDDGEEVAYPQRDEVAATGAAISLTPAGENVDENVQAAIDTLFSRTSRIADIDDLRIAQVFIDDFRAPNVSGGRIGESQWDDNLVGTGAVSANPLAASGTTVVLTVTAANDEAEIVAYFPVLSLGVMTMRWYLQMGPGNATQAYTAEWGWQQDDATPAGAWFRVVNNVASPDPAFVCVTSDGTTEETTTTAVLATDSTFFETAIEHDGAGVYRFYVNDVLVATHDTTVPGIAVMSPTAKVVKTVGSGTARAITIDYCAIRMEVDR